MTKQLLDDYAFTPGAAGAGTVVVPGTVQLEQFLLITNVTAGAIIYQFNKAAKGGTVSHGGGTTTLTLALDTSEMNSEDRLQVFADDAEPVAAVSVADLPLPDGAATEAEQQTGNASLASIDGKLPALSGGRLPVDVGTAITLGELEIKNDSGNPVPASVASLPLPNGAATGAKQDTGNASLASLDGKAPALVDGRVPVDGSAVTQPVSGPLTDQQLRAGAVAASVSSLPLPDGASTAANQGTANASLSSIDGKLPALSGGKVPVEVGEVEVKNDSGNPLAVSGPLTDTQLRASAVPVAPNVQQGGGAITGTTQRVTLATDGPTVSTLTSIDGKLPALSGGRVPVDGSGVTQPVSGPLTDTQLRASSVPVTSTVTARTPTTTSVASSASSVTILAANSNRRGVSIYNDSTATLRLSFSTPATSANAFIGLPAGAFLLLDQQLIITGAIYGIWSAANGTAQVTEFV